LKEDIIHIISSLLVGGAERFVLDLAKQQQLDGYKVVILNLGSSTDPLLEEAKLEGIETITIPTKRILSPKISIIKKLCTAKAIHAHNAVCIFRICPYIPFLKGSLVYTRHSEKNLSQATKLSHVLAKYKVHAVTFVSEGSKNSFYRQFNWPEVKSVVIDNGVFVPENKNFGRHENGAIKVITIGRMVPLKRQADLLKAAAELNPDIQNKIELHFFGDGELRTELEEIAKTLKIEAIFHGMELNREKIYSRASISTCMSETEGLSIALLESMAWSIPIIATNVGGNPKCVIDGLNGYLYEFGNIDELKEKLVTLIENKEMRINMGAEGKKRVEELFSIKDTAKQYYSCYWN